MWASRTSRDNLLDSCYRIKPGTSFAGMTELTAENSPNTHLIKNKIEDGQ
jgi:hypothetical protein